MDEAIRLKRGMKGMRFWRFVGRLFPRMAAKYERFSGFVVLERA